MAPDVESPTATLVNAHTASTSFGFPSVGSSSKTPGNNFESTSHSFNAANYTSISAGSSPMTQLRGVSPKRLATIPAGQQPQPPAKQGLGAAPPTAKTTKSTAAAAGEPDLEAANRRVDNHSEGRQSDKSSNNIFRRLSNVPWKIGDKYSNMDPVKRAYLRTSFVFAISILVTWTPSSVNRVYTAIHPDSSSWRLNMAAAVVLPLQGVWNAVIYFTTSWKLLREELEATPCGRRLLYFLHLLLCFLHLRKQDDETSRDAAPRARERGNFVRRSSGVRPPRSEMGRVRRLHGESGEQEGVELRSPMSSPLITPRRPPNVKPPSHVRVTPQGLKDFTSSDERKTS